MKNIKYIRDFFVSCIENAWPLFSASIALTFIYKALAMYIPFVIGNFIDNVSSGAQELTFYVLLFTITALLLVLLTPLQDYLMSRFVQKSLYQKSVEWMRTVFRSDLHFFQSRSVGSLVNSIDRGIASHEQMLYHLNGHLIPVIVEFIVVLALLLYLGAWSVVIGVLVLLLLQYFITTWLIALRRKKVEQVNEAEDQMAGELIELLSNGLVFKLEKKEQQAINRLSKPFDDYAKQSVALSLTSALMDALKIFASNSITLFALVYGSIAMTNQTMTTGEFVTLLTIIARLSGAFNDFLRSKKLFDQFDADIAQFKKALEYEKFDRDGLVKSEAHLLSVTPITTQRFTIDKKVTIKKGEKVAIVGPTGEGKSTLLEIMVGLDKKSREHVFIDDICLSQLCSPSHLDILRYCPQEHYLVSGTVSENVGVGQQESLVKMNLKGELCEDKKVLQEKAVNISGGEAKRLSLVRSLSKVGDIMLFDEPTSALNEQVASVVWDRLLSELKDQTMIATTHDYAALDRFDRIMVVNNGRIVADGDYLSVSRSECFKRLIR